jgi:hypothetical protein
MATMYNVLIDINNILLVQQLTCCASHLLDEFCWFFNEYFLYKSCCLNFFHYAKWLSPNIFGLNTGWTAHFLSQTIPSQINRMRFDLNASINQFWNSRLITTYILSMHIKFYYFEYWKFGLVLLIVEPWTSGPCHINNIVIFGLEQISFWTFINIRFAWTFLINLSMTNWVPKKYW